MTNGAVDAVTELQSFAEPQAFVNITTEALLDLLVKIDNDKVVLTTPDTRSNIKREISRRINCGQVSSTDSNNFIRGYVDPLLK